MRFRKRDKKVVFPVFDNYIDQILKFGFSMKYFPFSVNNILLKIKCNVFCNTEVFHCIRNNSPQFITDPEEMIYPGFACKNYS